MNDNSPAIAKPSPSFSRPLRIARVCIVPLSLVATHGCALEVDESGDVRALEQELMVETTRPLWTPGETANVCFVLGTGVTEDQFADINLYAGTSFAERLSSYYQNAKELAEISITETWGAYANLAFQFQGDCPSTVPANWISFVFRPKGLPAGSRSVARVGKGLRLSSTLYGNGFHFSNWDGRSDIQVFVGREAPHDPVTGYENPRAIAFRRTFVHEMGHVLGIPHEHNHPDEDCSVDRDNARPVEPLTRYDPDSVMNYCKSDGRFLTDLDVLGIQILYPHPDVLPVACKSGCFYTSGGPLVRSEGVLQDDWINRGAFPWWPSENDITWKRNGFTVSQSDTLSASFLQEGANQVFYMGTVRHTNTGVSGLSAVEKSDSKWTGIAMSVL